VGCEGRIQVFQITHLVVVTAEEEEEEEG